MISLTDKQVAEYFRRSYTAADGLWFMKVEESYGFEAALRTDEAVWRVLPKIQARAMKSMANLEDGMEGLYQGITTRLFLEGFDFRSEKDAEGFSISVRQCPWHELMVKSGRERLSGTVSNIICDVENSVWASEFGDIKFRREARICNGSCECLLRFTR
jgi:predicted ArsR family transcriptional regulator